MLKHSTARHDVPRSGETQYWTDHEIDRGHISPSYVSLSIAAGAQIGLSRERPDRCVALDYVDATGERRKLAHNVSVVFDEEAGEWRSVSLVGVGSIEAGAVLVLLPNFSADDASVDVTFVYDGQESDSVPRPNVAPAAIEDDASIEVTEEAEVEMPVPEEEHSDLDTADPAG